MSAMSSSPAEAAPAPPLLPARVDATAAPVAAHGLAARMARTKATSAAARRGAEPHWSFCYSLMSMGCLIDAALHSFGRPGLPDILHGSHGKNARRASTPRKGSTSVRKGRLAQHASWR